MLVWNIKTQKHEYKNSRTGGEDLDDFDGDSW